MGEKVILPPETTTKCTVLRQSTLEQFPGEDFPGRLGDPVLSWKKEDGILIVNVVTGASRWA